MKKIELKYLYGLRFAIKVGLFSFCFIHAPLASARAFYEFDNRIEHDTSSSVDSDVKYYTKDEIRVPKFANAVTIDSRVRSNFISLLNRTGANSNKLSELYHNSLMRSKTDYFDEHAYVYEMGEPSADKTVIQDHLKNGSEKAVSQHFIEDSKYFQDLGRGLNFELDFESIFKDKPAPKKEPKPKNNIKYGLVLNSVTTPDLDQNKQQASVSNPNAYRYADKASVEWTIGPIDATEGGSSVGPIAEPDLQRFPVTDDSAFNQSISTSPIKKEIDPNRWDQKSIPKLAATGNLAPANLKASDFESQEEGKIPPLRISLEQKQKLYRADIYTKPAKLERESLEHNFNVPLLGTMHVMKRYTEDFKPITTSVNDILIYENLPKISIFHHDIGEQFRTTATHTLGIYAVAIEARSPGNEKLDAKDATEQYELKVATSF